MAPHLYDEACLSWSHTKSAVKLLKRKLAAETDADKKQGIEDAMAFLRLRSSLRMAWHGSPKHCALESVGKAILDFEASTGYSRRKIRRMCHSIGFCLGDGQCYQDGLRQCLKESRSLRVSPKEAKTSEARFCLVMVG